MSRYYPSSRGGSRGSSRGYYPSYQSRGGYQSGGGSSAYTAAAAGGHYDSRAASGGAGGGGRYYPSRDRRDTGSGMGSTRNQLEIAKKLVDTLMQSSGGRRPADHYSSGEPPFKRPRDDSYDDRDRSRSRYSEHHHHRRDDYAERRPRHDEYRGPPPLTGRRPYRARGYAPRRGYVPRGAPPRRSYGDYDSYRDRSYNEDRIDPRELPSQRMVVTKCPHCHARCATFADFRKHQLGRDHMSAMRRVLNKTREELARMRQEQRQEQKELETAAAEQDKEAFEKLSTVFCALCRLQYKKLEGHVHDDSEHHIKQKAYQNPSCKICNMSFMARISYEKHLGTFTHIQKTTQLERRERRDADDFDKGGFMTLDSVGDVDEEDREDGDGDGPQLTAAQKLEELKEYDGKTSVGSGYMRKTEVYHCGLCDIYIKITAKVNAVLVKHCMGKKHFENYRKKLAKLVEKEEEEQKAAAEAAAAAAAAEKAKEEEPAEDAEMAQDNGHDEEAVGGEDEDAAAEDEADAAEDEDEPADEEPASGEAEPEQEPAPGADGASWEQMDDNFILGDDQEEEAEKKSDAAE